MKLRSNPNLTNYLRNYKQALLESSIEKNNLKMPSSILITPQLNSPNTYPRKTSTFVQPQFRVLADNIQEPVVNMPPNLNNKTKWKINKETKTSNKWMMRQKLKRPQSRRIKTKSLSLENLSYFDFFVFDCFYLLFICLGLNVKLFYLRIKN